MNSIENTPDRASYYNRNLDFIGSRRIQDNRELVQFRNNSCLRIWYNDIAADFECHCHNALEIIMPVENYFEVILNKQTIRVEPDEIVMIPPGDLHELRAPQTGIRFIYLFDISFMSRLNGFTSIQSLFSQPVYLTAANSPAIHEEIHQYLVQIQSEYFSKREYCDFTIYALLLNLLSCLGYYHIQTSDFFSGNHSGRQKDYVNKFHNIMNYIDTHYAEDLYLEQIAASAGFSKYHFSRLFKQYTDFTFCDYLNYRRIKAAELLLAQPELSITEIALQSGFTSISTFNRLFRKLKGCSPSEYRSKHTLAI